MSAQLAYGEALQQIKAQVAASRTSFHAGMAVLPKERREAMYGLYAFCRAVDDIADDSPTPEAAAQGLQEWRTRITTLFQGKATDAITTVLLPAVRAYNLPEKDFQEIIEGMAMDAATIVAPDLAQLDLYCDRVASAVGRISVRIFGHSGADAIKVAHHLGRALQLTNILRDIAEDATRGRLYLPRELLVKHGITTIDPSEVLRDVKLPALCRDLAAQARDHYTLADLCMKKCPISTMRAARIMRAYYGEILDLLVKQDWRDPATRVSLSKSAKFILMLKGYFG